jgi:hypothetical protein
VSQNAGSATTYGANLSLRSVTRPRPSRVAAGPGDEALTLAGSGRRSQRSSEYSGAAHLRFGNGLEDDAGELNRLGGDHDIHISAASQVPAVGEEVQGWEAQAVANGAPTDGRIHHRCQVDVRDRTTSGGYEPTPPGARISDDSGTWWLAWRPLGLSPRENLGSELNG